MIIIKDVSSKVWRYTWAILRDKEQVPLRIREIVWTKVSGRIRNPFWGIVGHG